MVLLLRWFCRAWLALAALVNLAAILGRFLTAPSFWSAVSDVQGWYSPFNVANFIAELVLISPAIGAQMLSDWIQRRRERAAASPATEGPLA